MTQERSSLERIAYLKGLARRSLESYNGGLDQLAAVVTDIKSIIRSFEEVGAPCWTKQLVTQWGQLEILCALVLDEERCRLTHEEEKDARAMIEALIHSFQD